MDPSWRRGTDSEEHSRDLGLRYLYMRYVHSRRLVLLLTSLQTPLHAPLSRSFPKMLFTLQCWQSWTNTGPPWGRISNWRRQASNSKRAGFWDFLYTKNMSDQWIWAGWWSHIRSRDRQWNPTVNDCRFLQPLVKSFEIVRPRTNIYFGLLRLRTGAGKTLSFAFTRGGTDCGKESRAFRLVNSIPQVWRRPNIEETVQ